MRIWTVFMLSAAAIAASLPLEAARATTIAVNCDATNARGLHSIGAALARFSRTEPLTILVSGTCNENVAIHNLDQVVLAGQPGASINDASNGALPTVDIRSSQSISITGLRITSANAAGAGSQLVTCGLESSCMSQGNTFTNASGDGVLVYRGSGLESSGDTFVDSAGRGLVVRDGARAAAIGDSFTNNGATSDSAQIRLLTHASLQLRFSTLDKGSYFGVRLTDHSTAEFIDDTITNHAAGGVSLESASEAVFNPSTTGNVITGNPGGGVIINDVSLGNFYGTAETGGTANNVISGNGTVDINCTSAHAFVVGSGSTQGGGTSNCSAP